MNELSLIEFKRIVSELSTVMVDLPTPESSSCSVKIYPSLGQRIEKVKVTFPSGVEFEICATHKIEGAQ